MESEEYNRLIEKIISQSKEPSIVKNVDGFLDIKKQQIDDYNKYIQKKINQRKYKFSNINNIIDKIEKTKENTINNTEKPKEIKNKNGIILKIMVILFILGTIFLINKL
jgi:hypothetical protein